MLVLLMTAVTGAWAQEQSETIATTANIVEGTHFTISISEDSYADEDGMLADGGITVTSKNGETITKVVITCTCYTDLVNDGTTSVSSGTKEITNGGGTITVTGVNASTFTFTCSDDYPQFGQFVVYYTEASAGPTGYTVSMKEGTEDATSWTIAPPEATTTGVAQGTEVKATYGGVKKVKSVKAKKKAAAAKTLAEATAEDLGKIVGADGKIYATKADAEAVATGNAVAMIAYVGTASDCAHGLAIALADESGTKNYGAAGTACSGKAAVTGGTWRLPSEKDWQYMFIGCGSSESYSAPTWEMENSYSGLASKLATAQGEALQSDYYWSSTEYNSSDAWDFSFDEGKWFHSDKSIEDHVRACLAF